LLGWARPFARLTVRVALGSVRRVGRGAWLELRDDAGRTGFGEASPLPGFSIDSLDDAVRAMDRFVVDRPRLDEVTGEAIGGAAADLAPTPAARFAVETALFDLAGQARGASIAELLAGRAITARVPVNALLFASDSDLVEQARSAARRG